MKTLSLPVCEVPCNGCQECCRNTPTTVSPLFGDDMTVFAGHACKLPAPAVETWLLDQQPNGDCVFLDRAKGCTIYEHRPAFCRAFDCATMMAACNQRGISIDGMTEGVQQAGRRLLAEGHVPQGLEWRLETLHPDPFTAQSPPEQSRLE